MVNVICEEHCILYLGLVIYITMDLLYQNSNISSVTCSIASHRERTIKADNEREKVKERAKECE